MTTQHNMGRPRMNGLSLRRVTRYMAVVAKEWEAKGRPELPPRETPPVRERVPTPAIPDPWDIERANQKQNQAPSPEPWTDDQVTVARERAGHIAPEEAPPEPKQDEPNEPFWNAGDGLPGDAEPLPWEIGEDEGDDEDAPPAPAFSSEQEREDFRRAMMYLSSDDNFLVTGVGKRQSTADAVAQSEGVQPKLPQQPQSEPTAQGTAGVAEAQVAQAKDAGHIAHITQRSPGGEWGIGGGSARPSALKIALIALLAALLLAAGGLTVWYFFFSEGASPAPNSIRAAAVFIGDENMGCVEDGQAIEATLAAERERVALLSALPTVLERPLRLEEVNVDARFVADSGEMTQVVLGACKVLVEATGVYVDGRLAAVARSAQDAQQVMDEALKPFYLLYSDRDIRDLGFCENVEIKALTAPPEDVLSLEELRGVLITGEAAAETYYEVVSGDSLIAIANRHEMQLGQLRYANPELIGKDLIQVGERLSLTPPEGFLTVQFTERVTEEIAMPFATETKTSASLYTTQQEVEKKGVDGLREVVADKVYVAGVLTQNNILRETVIKEPVTRVLVKGTKKVTNAGGSTTYIWPTQGSVSSTFKMRWGRMHNGLDIAAPTGTPIYAARDGKVAFSGTNGDYGKLVKISHGGGVETRYAHCSSLKVSSGDSVKKGQIIAYVGNTGRSTGSHLHFELRVGGEAKNPQEYLPK